ncbi:MAG TPA: methyltransferase [Gemmataceae bacterium]|nr:methyltransferase [Gemmataceae bacterium]
MARRRKETPLSQRTVPGLVRDKARPPLAVVLGSPAEVVHCLDALDGIEATCYQMDLHQSERLQAELAEQRTPAKVVTSADLWDLPADFQTVLYLPARGGERELKIDMIEQAFHILRPHGTLLVWSPYSADPFFPNLLKKIFGRVHAPHLEGDTVLWCQREGDRPRRRHEVAFQARIAGGPSCRFVSRPGTFSYGRFDHGARALVETMIVHRGDRVVDLGCGCGTNGVFAAQQTGTEGHITFADSNVRAVALADLNARGNGVSAYQTVASSRVEGLDEGSVDVVLANPPYYANSAIARLFIDRSRQLLKPEGRCYLVTKQVEEIADIMMETFEHVEAVLHRGYTILSNSEASLRFPSEPEA